MLDKTKYPNKQSIGETIRKNVEAYFKGVKQNKHVQDKVIKKVLVRKIPGGKK